jgi:antitoxin MazE
MIKKSPRTFELKVVPIGNSRGVRLPKAVLDRYAIRDALVAEEREDGLLLRNARDKRLGWDETFQQMAREREDWSDLDAAQADGLDRDERW